METIDEVELDLVCDGPPPAKKRAPVVVDLTLSSSDSEDDSQTLTSIKDRLLSRNLSSSQSSRPSTADSTGSSQLGTFICKFNSIKT